MPLAIRSVLRLAVLALALTAGMVAAHATPLDQETCDRLAQQEAQLVEAGIPAIADKGPAWAKANMSNDKVEMVRQYLGAEEMLQFRCARYKPLPPQALVSVPAVQPRKPKQAVASAPASSKAAAATGTGAATGTATAKAPAKPAVKRSPAKPAAANPAAPSAVSGN